MNTPLQPNTLNNKYNWANRLRAIATIGVILLHTSADASGNFGEVSNTTWWVGNLYSSATRWCVPIFVMLSGSFALEKYNGNLRMFYGKTFKRLVLPFIFWSIVYLLYNNHKFLFNPQIGLHQKASFIFQNLLVGTAVHLWFVYMILSMYLLFPFISKWTKYCSKNELLLFLGFWLLHLTLLPFTEDNDTRFDFSFFTGFVGYVILGNYLFKQNRKPNISLVSALLIGCYLCTVIGTYFLTKKDTEINESFWQPLTPNIVILSVCIYLLFKNVQIKENPITQKVVNNICKHSYGIYLIHILVLLLFNDCGFHYTLFNPIISIPIITIACFLVSFGLVYLLKKIAYLKNLIG